MVTGFEAYRTYISVKKIHFALSNNFDVMIAPIKRERFLNKWNKIRVDLDGKIFQKVEQRVRDTNTLILVFASYFINNENFYIRDIIDDNFKIFEKNDIELDNLEEIITNDFIKLINICQTDSIKPKQLFSYITLPLVFRYLQDISWNSMIVFDEVFKIQEQVNEKELNTIDKNKWLQYKNILVNYRKIIDSRINETDWKEVIRKLL